MSRWAGRETGLANTCSRPASLSASGFRGSRCNPARSLILLAGRFRGKRVILLKSLDQGVLLVTGPFKINGVPLRRVNARYVIATSQKVDLKGVDEKKVTEVSEPKYFTAEKSKEKSGEDAFFKQGEKPQVWVDGPANRVPCSSRS